MQVAWDDLPENIRAQYRNETGGMKVEGDLVTFPELADTLEAISQNGTDAFYADGRIAQSIVDTVSASGGIMTLEDLHTYTVREEEPLRAQYDGKFDGSNGKLLAPVHPIIILSCDFLCLG